MLMACFSCSNRLAGLGATPSSRARQGLRHSGDSSLSSSATESELSDAVSMSQGVLGAVGDFDAFLKDVNTKVLPGEHECVQAPCLLAGW
jgi:hypothetical protein